MVVAEKGDCFPLRRLLLCMMQLIFFCIFFRRQIWLAGEGWWWLKRGRIMNIYRLPHVVLDVLVNLHDIDGVGI